MRKTEDLISSFNQFYFL